MAANMCKSQKRKIKWPQNIYITVCNEPCDERKHCSVICYFNVKIENSAKNVIDQRVSIMTSFLMSSISSVILRRLHIHSTTHLLY